MSNHTTSCEAVGQAVEHYKAETDKMALDLWDLAEVSLQEVCGLGLMQRKSVVAGQEGEIVR